MDLAYTHRIECEESGRRFCLRFDMLQVSFSVDGHEIFHMPTDDAEMLARLLLLALKIEKPKLIVSGHENAGQAWTSASDAECLELWNSKRSLDEIARHFKRSVGAIRSRLKRLGVAI